MTPRNFEGCVNTVLVQSGDCSASPPQLLAHFLARVFSSHARAGCRSVRRANKKKVLGAERVTPNHHSIVGHGERDDRSDAVNAPHEAIPSKRQCMNPDPAEVV